MRRGLRVFLPILWANGLASLKACFPTCVAWRCSTINVTITNWNLGMPRQLPSRSKLVFCAFPSSRQVTSRPHSNLWPKRSVTHCKFLPAHLLKDIGTDLLSLLSITDCRRYTASANLWSAVGYYLTGRLYRTVTSALLHSLTKCSKDRRHQICRLSRRLASSSLLTRERPRRSA